MAERVELSYIKTIGDRGSGSEQFDYPEGISSVGIYAYVADKQNSRVQRFNLLNFTIKNTPPSINLPIFPTESYLF